MRLWSSLKTILPLHNEDYDIETLGLPRLADKSPQNHRKGTCTDYPAQLAESPLVAVAVQASR